MPNQYDVIVIGAGNGGLATAAFTAKNGLKTLLVEKHNIPGGSATSFVRGRFEFETSLHELCTLGTKENPGGIMKFFDMLGVDLEIATSMDHTFRLIVPSEGIDADMPCGPREFIGKLEQLVPGSAPSMMQVAKYGGMAAEAYSFMDSPEFSIEAMNERYPDFFRLAGHSVTEVLDELGMPKAAQNIITTYWGYLGAPPSELDFLIYARMLMGYIVYGAGMTRMRSHELSMSLEKVIRDCGGQIWYNSEAEEILVKDGKACGVVIGGKEYLAKHVVSNSHPNMVYGSMIDPEQVPEGAFKLSNSRDIGALFTTVYLGMNRTPQELGIDSYSYFIAPSSDPEVQYRGACNTRDFPNYVIMNCLNNVIPDCTPEGTCQLFFTTLYFGHGWDDVTPEEYAKIKNETAEKIIDCAEKSLGLNLRPYIEEIVVATPVTFARYLNSPAGTPYGYQAHPWDSFIQRNLTKKDESFIGNLYFAGAGTRRGDGYSSAYLSGLDAGQEVVRAERQKGGIER
ncbi:MAG: NAD(P)/FAD-dependent oxidoreductase [Lachnospiraceae bacterium]|nr:NAD(P)/FAD-dependent oxidoreductase [Lachnospiraceae bacterium]